MEIVNSRLFFCLVLGYSDQATTVQLCCNTRAVPNPQRYLSYVIYTASNVYDSTIDVYL